MATQLGQIYVVLTVDQALYYKLMQLKWMVPGYIDRLIPHLGGFYILLNFLKVIGQHMKGCSIEDAWVEGGILGPNSCEQVMSGKLYKKSVRTHKLTFQALWRLLHPHMIDYFRKHDPTFQAETRHVIDQ